MCTVYIVISILIHQCRARARAHNRELLAQYEVLLYLVPDLHKDIHLLDDKQVGVLAEYVRSLPSLGYLYYHDPSQIKHEAGKARTADWIHLVGRIIGYIAESLIRKWLTSLQPSLNDDAGGGV